MPVRRGIPLAVLVAIAAAMIFASAAAQSPSDVQAFRRELDAVRAAQEALQKDVQQIKSDVELIKNLLQTAMQGRPPDAAPSQTVGGVMPITIAGRPTRGSQAAKVTLIEFSDYQCPYCAGHVADVLPQIDREYVQTGQLRYVFKSLPIEQSHPQAFKAHVAAACAGDQGRYWEMHRRLFANQAALAPAGLVAHAQAIGLDAARFKTCLEGSTHDALIREDIDEALRGGVRGTPVFVFALAGADARSVTPVRVLMGAQPYSAFKEAIDSLLIQAKK